MQMLHKHLAAAGEELDDLLHDLSHLICARREIFHFKPWALERQLPPSRCHPPKRTTATPPRITSYLLRVVVGLRKLRGPLVDDLVRQVLGLHRSVQVLLERLLLLLLLLLLLMMMMMMLCLATSRPGPRNKHNKRKTKTKTRAKTCGQW